MKLKAPLVLLLSFSFLLVLMSIMFLKGLNLMTGGRILTFWQFFSLRNLENLEVTDYFASLFAKSLLSCCLAKVKEVQEQMTPTWRER